MRAAADGAELHAGDVAGDDLRAIGRSPRARCGPARGRLRRRRHPARGARRAAPRPAHPHRHPHHRRHRRAPASASRPARAAGASSPPARRTTPCAGRTATFLGVLKVAPADRVGVAPVAERLAALVDPPAARVAGGARLQGRPLAADARAVRARRASAATTARRRARSSTPPPLTPEDAAELERRRAIAPRRRRPRCCSSGSCARACTSAPRTCARCSGPARGSPSALAARRRPDRSSTTRTASCSTRRSRDRTASSPRSSSARTRKLHRPLGGAPRAHAQPGDAVLDRARRRSPPPRSRTASAGAWSRARCCSSFAFTFDCVDGQLARYTRQFSKLGAWLDSIFDRTKEYVVFAGLAIGAEPHRRPGVAAGVRGAHAADRRATRSTSRTRPSQHQVIARRRSRRSSSRSTAAAGVAATEPRRPSEAEDEDAEAPPPAPARPTLTQRAARLWRATDRGAASRWVKKMIAFPIGERFAAISITAALFDAARRRSSSCSRWGGFALALRPARPHAAVARVMSAAASAPPRRLATAAARSTPTATTARSRRALGRALGRRIPLPAVALLARRRRCRCCSRSSSRATARRTGSSPACVAWAVLLGGRRQRAPADRPAALGGAARAARDRVRRAAVDRRGARASDALARGVRAAVRDHLPPLRHRLRLPPPRRAAAALGDGRRRCGWDGRLLLARRAARRRRAAGRASTCWPSLLGVRCSSARPSPGGGASGRGQPPVYDDEEDEAD